MPNVILRSHLGVVIHRFGSSGIAAAVRGSISAMAWCAIVVAVRHAGDNRRFRAVCDQQGAGQWVIIHVEELAAWDDSQTQSFVEKGLRMSNTMDTTGEPDSPSDRTSQVTDAVAAAATESVDQQEVVITRKVVVTNEVSTRTLWRIVGVVVLVLVGFIVIQRARDLVAMLIISIFFSLALVPLVEKLHKKRGWKRGAAVGAIYGLGALFMVVMVVFLIPMMVTVAQSIGDNWSTWMDNINSWAQDTFNVSLSDIGPASSAGEGAAGAAEDWGKQALGGFLGALGTGIGLIFSAMTIALFTFYFTVDYQRIQRLVLSWFSPERQQRLGWTWDQAVEQTGGYFYSRLILMLINGLGFFFTMVLVGLPVLFAIPLAIFAGFVSEFIPAVGTYIGGAVPVLLTLAVEGFAQALVVLGYVLIYQQVENYWLSPKLSSKTMTLNGGVAFGAALAGGAIGGPMGAFMALPIAALITSFLTHYRKPQEVVYHSVYEDPDEVLDAGTDADAAASESDDSAG
jgi:predicted PurR-regulated permease PerM